MSVNRRVAIAAIAAAVAALTASHPRAEAPSVVFTRVFGGSAGDYPRAITVDGYGYIYVTGTSESRDLPVTPGAFQRTYGGAFVAKLDPQGAIVWLTYLGGSIRRFPTSNHASQDLQTGLAIAVDGEGYVYVTGETEAKDFPLKNALQLSPGSPIRDAFITKITPDGSNLVYSTYVGGTTDTAAGRAIAVAPGGAAVVALFAPASLPFVTTDLSAKLGAGSVVVLKMNPVGGLVFATRLGGTSLHDRPHGLALDSAGFVHVAGTVGSLDFPTLNAIVPKCPILYTLNRSFCDGGFAVVLDPSGTKPSYSTYVGGAGGSTSVTGTTTDFAGNSVIFGQTAARDFPDYNALQPRLHGDTDAFALTLSKAGTIVSSTFFGGSGSEWAIGVSSGRALVGASNSGDFPQEQGLLPRHPDGPLFSSVDGGRTWTQTAHTLGSTVTALKIAQAGPPAVYAATYAGLFRSRDNGGSWQSIFDSVPFSEWDYISAIEIDPRQPSTIYVVAPGPIRGYASGGGAYKTTDDGEHWTRIAIRRPGYPTFGANLAVDGNGTVFLTDNGVRKSLDGGATWINSSVGLPQYADGSYASPGPFVFDVNRPGVIYALGPVGTIYRATDGGASWTAVPIKPAYGIDIVNDIALAPGRPGRVYAATYDGVYRSDDDGVTWRQMSQRSTTSSPTQISVDPTNPDRVYTGMRDITLLGTHVLVSTNAGATWSPVTDISHGSINVPYFDPRDRNHLMVVGDMRALPFVSVFADDPSKMLFSSLLAEGSPQAIARDLLGDLYVLLASPAYPGTSHIAVTKISLSNARPQVLPAGIRH